MHVPGTCILICELLCCFSGPINYPSVSQQIQIEYAPSAPATITTHFNNNNMNLHVVPPPVALPPQSAPALQASAAAPQQLSLFNLFFKSVQEFPLRCVSSPSRQRLILLYLCLIVLFMSRESGRISWLCMPRLSVCVAGRALRSVLNLNLC